MTIISYSNKFIFIHPRRTGGTSLALALIKFCDSKDIVGDLSEHDMTKWIGPTFTKKYLSSYKLKKLNITGFYTFITSFIKVLPFVKSFFKFNYPPNFTLKIPFYVKNRLDMHSTIKEVKRLVDDDFFNEAIKFTIVRNPYHQFLSFYTAYHNKKNFKEFTKKESFYFFNREDSIISFDKTMPYNKIIKYENFKEDLEQLGKLIKLPENLYEIFKNIRANKGAKKDLSIIDKDSQKIIYKNAYHFFKRFGYSENINVNF